jgi:hypothetical protein
MLHCHRNNHGHINGWIGVGGVFGRLTKVE